MTKVAALFVDADGIYPELLGREQCWCGEDPPAGMHADDDARSYDMSWPVVAHPPCNLWVNFACSNYARATRPCVWCCGVAGTSEAKARGLFCKRCNDTGRREPNRSIVLPAWHKGGSDGGCFKSALASVRRCGGVLEHPAGSHAWAAHGLLSPTGIGRGPGAWYKDAPSTHDWDCQEYYVCEVWQSAPKYRHKARKRTWLLYCGKRPPFQLDWCRQAGTHQCGWFDRNKQTLSKREASATPLAFAEELIRLAEWSVG